MANRRPITMQEISFSNSQSQDSHLSVHLKEEPKNTLIQLLGTNTQTFCTASARVSVKSGSELLARYSGHLCLVNVKTDDDNSKQLQLFDLEKREIIWKQTVLDDTMEMTRDRNSLIIRFGEDQTIKLKFNSDSEAEEFFENAKVTIRVKSYERNSLPLPAMFDRKSLSTVNCMPAIAEVTSDDSEDQHSCASCIHQYSEMQGRKPVGNKQRYSMFETGISGPFDVKHVCHINADCKYIKGLKLFGTMPSLVPPSQPVSISNQPSVAKDRKISKFDIGQPFDFKHLEHVRFNTQNDDGQHDEHL